MIASRTLTLQQEQARIDAAREAFIARGKTVQILESFQFKPTPARKETIDPETILKRRPKALSRSERQALRKMADSL
ncbi:hypothetical protein PS870_01681 [Pseudomonas fluorescens]|uniref:Uncharacterized protein n=1 Tax=Pseudomonas fluorescens TaxID=294 RepID=A0A5E7IPF2_PSEFL|nr:hypothetical protein [Pseudomonas fluorescens]VVO78799.1 hypothetical protein PS870_01681 [Pseudomonas fluorescens]